MATLEGNIISSY